MPGARVPASEGLNTSRLPPARRSLPRPPEGARTGGGARETELYQSGAKAFHEGNWDEARARFLEVLALPVEERRRFSTFAAFMRSELAKYEKVVKASGAKVD